MATILIGLATCICLASTSLATPRSHDSPPVQPSSATLAHTTISTSRTCTKVVVARKRPRTSCLGQRWYSPKSAWNTPIPRDPPIAPSSSSLIAGFNNKWCLNAGCFGPGMVAVPSVWFASSTTPLVTVDVNFPTCGARHAHVPIPTQVVPEGPPEPSTTVMVGDTGVEWDLFKLTKPGVTPLSSGPVCQANGNWAATRATKASPGWTGSGTLSASPRGSGTLYGSGLIRPRDTKKRGVSSWDHAIALAYRGTLARTYAWPAVHSDGTCVDASACVPMGSRLQLDPTIDCARWPSLTANWQRQACRTLQRYGMIVVDTGSAMLAQNQVSLGSYVYPWAPRWDNLPVDLATRLRVIDWKKWTGRGGKGK